MNIESKPILVQSILRQVRYSSPFSKWMLAYTLLCGIILLLFPKTSIHLRINQFHSAFLDNVFKHATFFGDGISATILVIILLFISYRYASMMAISNIACSIIVQSLKRLWFTDSVRPYEFFKGVHSLYLVPGVEVYSFNSFPSGHSATIFTTCTLLCLMVKQRSLRILLFIIAVLVAFSRVYLSQHFLGDAYAGSIIGVTVAYMTAAYWWDEGRATSSRFDQSLMSIFKNR
jgi:membrane-associated phospholipid phosphatase